MMVPPVGTIYGRSGSGNFKVESKELDRPTVLIRSKSRPWKKGDKIRFDVTGVDGPVYLSASGNYNFCVEPDSQITGIELVLYNPKTREFLMIGNDLINSRLVRRNIIRAYRDLDGKDYVLAPLSSLEELPGRNMAEKLGLKDVSRYICNEEMDYSMSSSGQSLLNLGTYPACESPYRKRLDMLVDEHRRDIR